MQDRLVKELRLRGISTVAQANAYAPCFMADYNARFAKPPRSAFDAHRPLRADESLERALTWREARRVTKALTVQYDRVLYLLEDTDENRALIYRDIEVWEHPDGRMELHAGERELVCRQYDRLTEVEQGPSSSASDSRMCSSWRRRCRRSAITAASARYSPMLRVVQQ